MATVSHNQLSSTPVTKTSQFANRSSLPTPIFQENLSFSSKRDRKDLELTPEPSKPRPRIQSISRCFKRSLFNGPKVVGGLDETSFLSTPGYSDKAKQTYLQQCFKITKVLGEGSFGKVYKCTEKLSGVEYAVKMSEGYNTRSLEEVRKHEALSVHINCVTFVKAWEERRTLHIQMELCDESLGHYVRRIDHKLSECEVWRILQHSLSGLDHFHSNGLLHMDIKPDNIFRCTSKTSIVYKLGDFGLAITCNDLNKTDLIEGDSKYLAPELLDGRCDGKADVFSIGISILELIAKIELPNNGDLWQSLRSGELPPTPGFSFALHNIVAEMMNKDPDKRPNISSLLNNSNHKYYKWLNYFKDKGSSMFNNLWTNWSKRQDQEPPPVREDIFKDIKELEDDIEIKAPQLTPILLKKYAASPKPTPGLINSPRTTPIRGGSPYVQNSPRPSPHTRAICSPISSIQTKSPQVWPGSPLISPVPSSHSTQSLLYMSNKLEASTPIKSFAFDESELEELDEGDMFERPSMIKRNLLDSFDDNQDDGEENLSF